MDKSLVRLSASNDAFSAVAWQKRVSWVTHFYQHSIMLTIFMNFCFSVMKQVDNGFTRILNKQVDHPQSAPVLDMSCTISWNVFFLTVCPTRVCTGPWKQQLLFFYIISFSSLTPCNITMQIWIIFIIYPFTLNFLHNTTKPASILWRNQSVTRQTIVVFNVFFDIDYLFGERKIMYHVLSWAISLPSICRRLTKPWNSSYSFFCC